MHSDEEAVLLGQGSAQGDLWGINIYPDKPRTDWIEFDSLINSLSGISTNSEKYRVLQRAQQLISTEATSPLPGTPEDYVLALSTKRGAFAGRLSQFQSIQTTTTTSLFTLLGSVKALLPVSSLVQGCYDIRDICLSVPSVVSRKGVEKHVEIKLWPKEQMSLQQSARALKETMGKVRKQNYLEKYAHAAIARKARKSNNGYVRGLKIRVSAVQLRPWPP